MNSIQPSKATQYQKSPLQRAIRMARVQLTNTRSMWWVPLLVTAGALIISLLIFWLIPEVKAEPGPKYTGGANAPLWYFLAAGIQSAAVFFPFSVALGSTRRDFVVGSMLIGLISSLAMATVFTVGGFIEILTNGWGMESYFFHLALIWNDGWFGAFVMVAALVWFFFTTGFATASLYKRFGTIVLMGVLFLLALLIVGAIWLIGITDSWGPFLQWFTTQGPFSLALMLFGIGLLMMGGSYLALRRMEIR